VQDPRLNVLALRARLDGEVVTPSDETWDQARHAWNLAVDRRPAAVVYAESADDADTVLLKTSRMREVEVDAESRTARVEAGVLWLEVVEAAADYGLATLAG